MLDLLYTRFRRATFENPNLNIARFKVGESRDAFLKERTRVHVLACAPFGSREITYSTPSLRAVCSGRNAVR